MLLGGVQIPAEVITAWEERNLVIFTGAGISMDPPSDLPSFLGLAAQVAHTVQSPLNPADEEWRTEEPRTFRTVTQLRLGCLEREDVAAS
ncbi:hypothetical protein, partial [Kribbella sp. DT2]|uniref:hypothetical protein n=1 Tax=Kribbella sp. DT2 TaxID=3393427 RepID=UPI003CF17ED8